jgi:hypothetical protein
MARFLQGLPREHEGGSEVLRRAVTVCLVVIIVDAAARSQDRLPSSFSEAPGLHVTSHDGLPHRSEAYYGALCAVVDSEMGISRAADRLHIVFVDQETSDRIIAANPGRFQGKDFTGAFIPPGLIVLVGVEESDDTFMHEYLHYLHAHGLVFRGVPQDHVHRRIEETEGYLLASLSYIRFLQSQP